MTLDPQKLRRDAKRLNKVVRPRSGAGPTDAIRSALPVIRELRKDKVKWSVIAKALTEQGVVQANGRPLTASGLTSIVFQISKQEQRARDLASRERPDVAREQLPAVRRLRLSDELFAPVSNPQATAQSEDELRELAYQKLQGVLKKD